MFMDREGLIRCFEDTERLCRENEQLRQDIRNSVEGTRFYPEGKSPEMPAPRFESTDVAVEKYRSFETALHYRRKFPGARIAVHNFASATNPGGGVRYGSRAQEESLCRCSTLLPVLETEENWHCQSSIPSYPSLLPFS